MNWKIGKILVKLYTALYLRCSTQTVSNLVMNINSLTRFKAKNEAKKVPSNTIKYHQTKTKLSYTI